MDSSFVLGLTINLPVEPVRGPMHNLPVPDFDETGFFGRRSQVARVKRLIKGAYPVVSILGDGGIGKTSVALKVAYEILDDANQQFDSIVWVTAKATTLTASEIRRVNDAIEDSLGLFVSAASELGGQVAESDAIGEVLAYLENFRVLLILDNMETVLDARLREFLLDLPMGSKVMLTSRIGLGVENPVQLEPLTSDESHHFLRALSRIRNVTSIESMEPDSVRMLADQMEGHPLFLKWFVSGVQAGIRPEDLLADNSLLLDFCMSNVYEYLTEDARKVLKCMQVLPGEKRQAEIAFLDELDASGAQAAILRLMTTNFVHMETHSRGQSLETTYQLSDFARSYLDKQHPVESAQRLRILARHQEMQDLGWELQAENSASPYDPATINVRDSGDFSTARLLRDALSLLERDSPEEAIRSCEEARALSPTYAETWRVEAVVQTSMRNMTMARSAYERAIELDPESPNLHFQFGSFLSEHRLDLNAAVRHLRKSAQLDPDNPTLLSPLSWTLLVAGLHDDASVAAARVLQLNATEHIAVPALCVGLRAHCFELEEKVARGHVYDALENLELALELISKVWAEIVFGESGDRLLLLRDYAVAVRDQLSVADNFRKQKASGQIAAIDKALDSLGVSLDSRHFGVVQNVIEEKAYGFIRPRVQTSGQARQPRDDYFFHITGLADESEWPILQPGAIAAYTPIFADARGRRRAVDVRWIGNENS
ncbi:NB-ARC domain-containing protein [Pseudonocardia sp. TMWB2A]|uniref:NB-ARC domain-containing protein n=1 Tax=Pseudonocardia sp. TMWB2A TaxID=687430 RepID=UPI00307EA6B0